MKLNEVLQKNVDVRNKKLKSLKGLNLDKKRAGVFYCNHNQLTSLEGCPAEIKGLFNCSDNQLSSLAFAPTEVGGSFMCSNNKLTSLKGAPAEVGGNFYCISNQLTSLKDVHKVFNKIDGRFIALNNDITHAVLGLLLIYGIKEIQLDNDVITKILNKHLGKMKAGVLAAQQELIDADLEDYAEL